ncbi:MAG: serine hydrolase domain-containing protein [Bacteroidota bacterium]
MMKFQYLYLFMLGCWLSSCSTHQSIGSYVQQLERDQKVMGTVTVFKNGQSRYQQSIGFANIEQQKAADEQTLYRIGSISKTFTAALILQLIAEEKLSFETPLATYFPKVSQAAQITIADLLYHRSGLYDITRAADFETWVSEPREQSAILMRIYESDPLCEPNTKTQYTNTNYLLLSFIAEAIEQQDFEDILAKRIVAPLQLKHTIFGKAIDLSQNEAMCYYPEDDIWQPITFQTYLANTMGAGGVVSTAQETAFFYDALFSGQLLPADLLTTMTEPKDNMGMGFEVTRRKGYKIYAQTGAIDGFRSVAAYFPKEQLTIVCTLNAAQISVQEILFSILKMYKRSGSKALH